MQDRLNAMSRIVQRHVGVGAVHGVFPRFSLFVADTVTCPTSTLYRPMLCLVLQGAKQVMIGDRMLRYDPASYFVATLDLPVSGHIIEASRDQPYVCASLELDHDLIAALVSEMPDCPAPAATGFATSPVTPRLLDSWARLIDLLDNPQDSGFLAPLIEREILYHLLQGPQGSTLRQIAQVDSRLSQVRRAIGWIRKHYDQTLRVDALAELAGMSLASFHRHFKAATAMSPLQYQKRLRLQEARRLMVTNADAARTAYAVGYESPSQFSREYARMFGAPPARDAERLRMQPQLIADIPALA